MEFLSGLLRQEIEKSDYLDQNQVHDSWRRDPLDAFKASCDILAPDLVIKCIEQPANQLMGLQLNFDSRLLQESSVPLILVRQTQGNHQSRILAAIDAGTQDVKETQLNNEILGYASL